MKDSPEQPSQQGSAAAEPLLLFGDTSPALIAVLPIEHGDAVDEEERQLWSGHQGGLKEVEGEEELRRGGAVHHQQAGQTRTEHCFIRVSRGRAGASS